MRFVSHVPAAPLSRFVDRFYGPSAAPQHQCEYVMPGPLIDMKINFGGAVSAQRADANHWEGPAAEGWCMGVWDRYHSVRWPADLDYVGITFRPGGFTSLFGADAQELGNSIVPIDALLGSSAASLREQLASQADLRSRFALLEHLFTRRIRENRDLDRIAPALGLLEKRHGGVPVAELAAMTDVSHKHLVTLFNRVAGTSPKTLARLYRFQHVLGTIGLQAPQSWTRVAHDLDYFDQAHFNKDFKRLSGHTPGSFFEQRARTGMVGASRLLPRTAA